MKIKTIRKGGLEVFDEAVNAALADGWQLTRRELLINSYDATDYYAELMLPDPQTAEAPAQKVKISPVEAARIVKAECDAHGRCHDCLLYAYCDHDSPDGWDFGPNYGGPKDGGTE